MIGYARTMAIIVAALMAMAATVALTIPMKSWAATAWRGDYFPNVTLTNHDGKSVRFYDDLLKGKVVAISFIYTKCPDVCPMDTAKLRQVQELLSARMGKDIHFYSISIDPKNDTPPVLKDYRTRFDVTKGWTFLTGTEKDVAAIQKKLGFPVAGPANLRAHSTSIMLGNERSGRWIKRSAHDNARMLADLLSDMANAGRAEGGAAGRQAYSNASQMAPLSRGETLFRTRCASCHFIGKESLGPDLANVSTRRKRAWLIRWIKEPDRMLAEGDPIATAQFEAYKRRPMPNFGLNDADAAALIDFIDSESRLLKPHVGHH